MPNPSNMREGGRLLVDQLSIHGVDTVFAVPGESYLPVLDGLYAAKEHIKLVTCRMEAGAANMAEAYAKLTGRPGICMVTRGPGATHASVGVHTAAQDSSPFILFVGQVGRAMRGREAFQEIDYTQMFGAIAKWVVEIDDAERIPELVARAFATASSGRPGPVVVALPEDILSSDVTVGDARPYRPVRSNPSTDEMAEFGRLLEEAERPLVIVGGGTWTPDACADLQIFAERHGLPVAAAFRSQDVFDNEHPLYVGDVGLGVNPKLMRRLQEADLLVALGTRLEENVTAGYSTISIPCPANRLVHVHPRTEELGRVYQAELPINAGMPELLSMARNIEPCLSTRSQGWAATLREDYESYQRPLPAAGAVNMTEIVTTLRTLLPPDAIIANGAGNYSVWVHRFHRYRSPRSQLAPTSGAMGYGVPAAIAAKFVHPERPVVSFNGDGCFLMCGQEIATAVQHGLNPVFIVVNNGMYGTIRMHQERHYPARVWGTDLVNPDFVTLGRAYGLDAERVMVTSEFAPALKRALASPRASLIEIVVDSEALTPMQTLSEIRALAQSS